MNASFLANFIPLDFRSGDDPGASMEFAVRAKAAFTMATNFAPILERVHPSQYSEVIAILGDFPEAEPQLNLVLSLVRELEPQFRITANELIPGTNPEGWPTLDLYVRINEDFDTFNNAKNWVRSRYNSSQSRGRKVVVPIIIRRPTNV